MFATRREHLCLLGGAALSARVQHAAPPVYHASALHPYSVIDGGNKKVYINSVCVTQRGSWLVSFTCGKDGGMDHYVALRRSTDRGRTWESRRVVRDPDDPFDCEMGQLFAVPGARRIYQFHIVKNRTFGIRFGRLVFTVSDDDGRTWNGPDGPDGYFEVNPPAYRLAPNNYGWHLMAPGRVLSHGEFILPMNVSTDPRPFAEIRSEAVFLISPNILTERDPRKLRFDFYPRPPSGVAAPIRTKPGESLAQEPQVVELSDKRLFCVMRTGNGCVYYTVSEDAARTWRNPAEPLLDRDGGQPVLNPNCAVPLTKLSRGRYALLHCNNDGTYGGGKSPFDAARNRNPVYVSIGREAPGAKQPLEFCRPRLLCSIDGYKPETKGRDLTYGALLEDGGEYFHFYNAVWEDVMVNRVDPAKLEYGG
jgi:hypothetical protein